MDWGELIRVLLSAAIGTMGFGWLFHAPRKAWLPAALLGNSFLNHFAMQRNGSRMEFTRR